MTSSPRALGFWGSAQALASLPQERKTPSSLRDESVYSRGTTPLGSLWSPLGPTAHGGAIGYPFNAGSAERATYRVSGFTRRLRSELQRAFPGRGSQSTASPPWRYPPAYSSPSLPLACLATTAIMPQNSRDVKKGCISRAGRRRGAGGGGSLELPPIRWTCS